MSVEIERKFLVKNENWKSSVRSEKSLKQGYLSRAGQVTLRARISGDKAWLTLKGASEGISRLEFEYEIPRADAEAMLARLCADPPIEKTRYLIDHAGHTWELDVFDGANAGLVMAEIELSSEDEAFDLPGWAGDEVSDDPRYYNASLSKNPYKNWT